MNLLNPSAYGLWHDKKDILSKLGKSHGQPIPFCMAKILRITYWEIKGRPRRLADESVVAMRDMDNITYPSKGTLDK